MCMKGALTKMVKALVPRQKKEKSIFVSTKYNSRITSAKRRISLQGKSSLCTKKYFQSDGVFEDAKKYTDTK